MFHGDLLEEYLFNPQPGTAATALVETALGTVLASPPLTIGLTALTPGDRERGAGVADAASSDMPSARSPLAQHR